ncbi:MAG: tetratricopeptide repeat protein [Saprospiraceae bacterium]
MKKLFPPFVTLLLWALPLLSQEPSLYGQGQCDSFVRESRLQLRDTLSAQVCLMIGVCLMQQSEYASALEYLDDAVRKNHELAVGYLYKAEVLLHLNRLEEALVQYDNAIYLRPDVPDFFVSKGYALFLSGRYAGAIACFQQALAMPACPERAYVLLGRAFEENTQVGQAVEAYALALYKLPPGSDVRLECLHRMGLAEYLRGNYPAAEAAFVRILDLAPDDYQAMSRLIQTCYAAGQYERGNALKMGLYGAYNRGLLTGEWLEKGFCFDQFMWEGKRIYAYERFEEPAGYFSKHVFYLTDENDHVLETIQTEHTLEASLKGKKYTLGRIAGGVHERCVSEAFDDNFDYLVLKKAVIRILKGKCREWLKTGID